MGLWDFCHFIPLVTIPKTTPPFEKLTSNGIVMDWKSKAPVSSPPGAMPGLLGNRSQPGASSSFPHVRMDHPAALLAPVRFSSCTFELKHRRQHRTAIVSDVTDGFIREILRRWWQTSVFEDTGHSPRHAPFCEVIRTSRCNLRRFDL